MALRSSAGRRSRGEFCWFWRVLWIISVLVGGVGCFNLHWIKKIGWLFGVVGGCGRFEVGGDNKTGVSRVAASRMGMRGKGLV